MRTEIEEITPERAKEILAKSNTRNRPINRERVANLVKELKSGEWVLTPQGIAFDRDGVLVDGQHRLKAIAISETPVEMSVAYDLEPRAAAKMDQGLPRTASHVLAAQGSQYSTRLAAAARSILVAQGQRPSNTQVVTFANKHERTLLRYIKIADRYGSPVHAAFALADMLGWPGVEDCAERLMELSWTSGHDPMRALAKTLSDMKTEGSRGSNTKFLTALNAIKAACDGEELQQARKLEAVPARLRSALVPEALEPEAAS